MQDMLDKFTDKYLFDIEGNVYSKYGVGRVPKLLETPKKMKSQLDKDGYVRFTLRDNNKKQYTVFQHKIVLIMNEMFPTEEQTQVNHIDGNKQNNILLNLEWCTGIENSVHRNTKLQYRNQNIRKFTPNQIQEIRLKYKPFTKGSGITSLASTYNISYSSMRDIVQHRTYNSDLDYKT